MERIKALAHDVVEVGLLLAAIGVLAQILFGGELPFVGGVATNLTGLINSLGENGLVGLISLGIIAWLFSKRG